MRTDVETNLCSLFVFFFQQKIKAKEEEKQVKSLPKKKKAFTMITIFVFKTRETSSYLHKNTAEITRLHRMSKY